MEKINLNSGRRLKLVTIALFLLCLRLVPVFGLQNNVGAHDPSSIIKCGNTYWIFTTGNGIYAMYSTDLIKWTAGTTPFTQSDWPSWITRYVPDFAGHFWAPECIYMNGRYYLYYSCSYWGVKTSAIGLATNLTLDPASPDYEWIDEGMVVFSDENSNVNCIDPSLFWDEEGKLWLSYGSYFGGIRFAELNPSTGKPLNDTRFAVASGNCEASYVIHHGEYYYLFINRGTCCQGTSSTYHIQVGRSSNPTGPFLDKEGVNLNANGGSTILSSDDNFIGPGCLGYFAENGIEWASYHYYDGNAGGMATLGIANLRWDATEWPIITSEWIPDGIYSIASKNNYYVWQSQSCTDMENEPIVQGYYSFDSCQQWKLSNLGNGYYTLNSAISELSVVLDECNSSAGTPLILGPYSGQACEIWRIERSNGGLFSIASKYGNRVAALSVENNENGTPIELGNYSGIDLQKWIISDTSINITSVDEPSIITSDFSIYPNPLEKGPLNISINKPEAKRYISIISMDGRLVYKTPLSSTASVLSLAINPGIYWVVIEGSIERKKLLVL
jgi:arabinan endo-1,5-alpha-L-arabinosidase